MDIISYVMGKLKGLKEGSQNVTIESETYEFIDTNSDGNVVIQEGE